MSAAGHDVETPADVVAWLRHGQRTVVLLTLARERDWELLRRLRDAGDQHAVIALIGEEEPAALGVQAIQAGARSVLPREVTPRALSRTVEATFDGQAVMPSEVAAALASGARGMPVPPTLSPRQLSWLRQLSEGATVAQLARRAGYSERAMFRLLQALYREIGASTRIQAIVRAQEEGWLHRLPDFPSNPTRPPG
ncbi:hypothetical protein [Nonomuraea sp. NPDC003214]